MEDGEAVILPQNLTKLDWFAGMALKGYEFHSQDDDKDVAVRCYKVAREMVNASVKANMNRPSVKVIPNG